MGLEPDVAMAIELVELSGLYEAIGSDPAESRRILRAVTHGLTTDESRIPVESVEDFVLAGRPGRIYRPDTRGDQPVLIHFHGGGFVMGGIDSYDQVFRRICRDADLIVVAPELPCAPEEPFPAAPWHALSATAEVLNDVSRYSSSCIVMVGGESSGANIAAVVAQQFKTQLALQYLVTPTTDAAGDYDSRDENSVGYLLTRELLVEFLAHYLAVTIPDLDDPMLSPFYGDLRGLPPALVATAQFDPLRDEGETYAHRMRLAGVDVELVRFDNMIHGFGQLAQISETCAEVSAELHHRLRVLAHRLTLR